METEKLTERIIDILVVCFIAIWFFVLLSFVFVQEQTKPIELHKSNFKLDSLLQNKKPLN